MQIALARYLVTRNLAVNREIAVLPWGRRRADLLAMDFKGTKVVIVEQKSSVADFTGDKKWEAYLDWCHSFYFAFTRDTWERLKKKKLAPDHPRAGVLVLDPNANYWKFSVCVVKKAKKGTLTPEQIHTLALRLAYRGARWRSKDDVRKGGNRR